MEKAKILRGSFKDVAEFGFEDGYGYGAYGYEVGYGHGYGDGYEGNPKLAGYKPANKNLVDD